jgi:hypothetical protein
MNCHGAENQVWWQALSSSPFQWVHLDTLLGWERGEGPYREKPSMELKHLTPTHEPEREISMNNARPHPRPNLGLAPLPQGEGETLPAS